MGSDPTLPAPLRAFADALSIHFSTEKSEILQVLARERGGVWEVLVLFRGDPPSLDLSPWRRSDGVVRFGGLPLHVEISSTFPSDEGWRVAGSYADSPSM